MHKIRFSSSAIERMRAQFQTTEHALNEANDKLHRIRLLCLDEEAPDKLHEIATRLQKHTQSCESLAAYCSGLSSALSQIQELFTATEKQICDMAANAFTQASADAASGKASTDGNNSITAGQPHFVLRPSPTVIHVTSRKPDVPVSEYLLQDIAANTVDEASMTILPVPTWLTLCLQGTGASA